LDPYETMNGILSACKKLGVRSVAVAFTRSRDQMVRFSNNSVTVVNSWQNEVPTVYLASNGKRAACRIEEEEGVEFKSIASELVDSMNVIPRGDVDFDLPRGPFNYEKIDGIYDRRLTEIDTGLVDAAEAAINSARKEGANRVSGVVISGNWEHFVLTSAGAEGSSKGTEIEITVRAFADEDATGQGISIATNLDRFHPDEAGVAAGSIARKARGALAGVPGKYNVVFGPSIFANLLNRVGSSASAYTVDQGLSFFGDKIMKKVASNILTLHDNSRLAKGPGSTALDDEGYPTQEIPVILDGVLQTYLHTSFTAAEHKATLTGSAIFDAGTGMYPTPRNLVLKAGESSLQDLFDKAHEGLYITNNWYTRFQNYQTGDFSTICRDGVFEIKNGRLAQPVKGLRLSDNILRILQSVKSISKEQHWIRWWEVDVPTLTPYVLVEGVGITTANK